MDKRDLNVEIGARIRRRREVLGCTREQIAERANISVQFLFDIERGKKSMTALTIVKLAEALSVSIDFMLLGTRRKEERPGAPLEQIFSLLVPEQRQLAEEILRLFVRGVSMGRSEGNR